MKFLSLPNGRRLTIESTLVKIGKDFVPIAKKIDWSKIENYFKESKIAANKVNTCTKVYVKLKSGKTCK